jgi:hypothetical protein
MIDEEMHEREWRGSCLECLMVWAAWTEGQGRVESLRIAAQKTRGDIRLFENNFFPLKNSEVTNRAEIT